MVGTSERPFSVITNVNQGTGCFLQWQGLWGQQGLGATQLGVVTQMRGNRFVCLSALRIVAPSTWMSNASREWGDAPVCSDL